MAYGGCIVIMGVSLSGISKEFGIKLTTEEAGFDWIPIVRLIQVCNSDRVPDKKKHEYPLTYLFNTNV